ncbi:MAG: tRNA pseudouridine(38-40) synthase TruA [Candidatus Coproplasma sp.]
MRYAVKVAYDGTDYCGWQVQKNGISVQQKLEEAAYTAFGVKAQFTASGRTDGGVHAQGQVCHVDMNYSIAGERLADALNARLPRDISVLESAVAPQGFDANRSAKKKTYLYRLYFSKRRNPLKDRYSVWVKGEVDERRLCEAASLFVGEHDFKAYCASGSQVKTTVRTVYSIETERNGEDICIAVCGNGFLYNMVRTLVGTMLFYALGRISAEDIVRSIEQCDRSLVGKTMPANGLTLLSVDYGIELFDLKP